jgi:hypothetical protein
MRTACGSRLDWLLRFALFHGEAQSPVTVGRLELPALQRVRRYRNWSRYCQKQQASPELILLALYAAQMRSSRLLVTVSKIYCNKALIMSICTAKRIHSQGSPKLSHKRNCADIFESQLAWPDHEVPAAVKGCFGDWCMCDSFPASNASGSGKGLWGSEVG